MSHCIEKESHYGANNYAPLPVVLVKGQGACVWDENGRCYLDMMGAYSAVSHGHCHPRLVNALKEQAERLAIVSRAYHTDRLGLFLERACKLSGQECQSPPLWSHFVFGVMAPLDFRRDGAIKFSA